MPVDNTDSLRLPSHLRIPKPVGEVVFAVCLDLFTLVFILLAAYCLIVPVALLSTIASAIWLLVIAWYTWANYATVGVKAYLTELGRAMAAYHFVEWLPRENLPAELRIGYRLFGRHFYLLCLPIDAIQRVYWSPGQASSLAGKDMHDWSIILRYASDAAITQSIVHGIHVIGPGRRKEDAEAWCLGFIAFLNNAGAMLVREKDAYLRAGRQQA